MQPSDVYVQFNAADTAFRSINVNSASNLRGLYFLSTAASGDGFNFSGSSTLTIGRGGITNYDSDRQVFTSPITLGDHQYWDVGSGGVTVANVNTNGRLLEIAGSGVAVISGNVSGTGGIALSGNRLEMTGQSSYTGSTWVHSGRLEVTGDISASAGIILAATGELSGNGSVGLISGSGSVHPGLSPGILTADQVDPTGGLDFFFELTQLASPTYSNASASGNDVLRLTDSTPFLQNLNSDNTVHLFFNIAGGIALNDVIRGGFFTDAPAGFDSALAGATFVYHVADIAGPAIYDGNNYAVYSGPLAFQITTVAETADFGLGSVDGRVMELTVIPEPSMFLLVVVAGLGAVFIRRRRE